jgi:hypothetical protein
MTKNYLFRFILGVSLIVTPWLMLASGSTTVQASSLLQGTPVPEATIVPSITEVVPSTGTGGGQAFFLPGWAILALVAFVLIVLMLALVLRAAPATTTTVHHHDAHDHVP